MGDMTPSSEQLGTPMDDLVAHEPNVSCVCGPAPVPIVTPDGHRTTTLIHRRLDGKN